MAFQTPMRSEFLPLSLINRNYSFSPPTSGQKALGFRYNPFALRDAEKWRPELLEEIFVAPPGYDEKIRNLGRSTVLLAPPGGGKTACRLQLAKYLGDVRRRAFHNTQAEDTLLRTPLAVTYREFERVAEKIPNVRLSDHAEPLMAAIAQAVHSFIDYDASRFNALELQVRSWWEGFLTQYPQLLPPNALQRRAALSFDQRSAPPSQLPFHPDSSLSTCLECLTDQLRYLGLDTLVILVDGLDGYLETADRAGLEKIVNPLVNTLPLFSIPGLLWKFFLPNSLKVIVNSSSGIRTGRLDSMEISWGESDLKKLFQAYLKSAAGYEDLAQLSTEKLLARIDPLSELVGMAMKHRQFGGPRALSLLAEELFRSSSLISSELWEAFCDRVRNDLHQDGEPSQDERTDRGNAQEPSQEATVNTSAQMINILVVQIGKDLELIDDLDDTIRSEQDPIERARYGLHLDRTKKELRDKIRQVSDLWRSLGKDRGRLAKDDIQIIINKLDAISKNVADLSELIVALRQDILARFDSSETLLVRTYVDQLDLHQAATVEIMLSALEEQRFAQDEMLQFLADVRQVLVSAQGLEAAIPNKDDLLNLIDDSKLEIRHRLKLVIPIIPQLLPFLPSVQYEGDIAVGSGVNLANIWDKWVNSCKGKPPS